MKVRSKLLAINELFEWNHAVSWLMCSGNQMIFLYFDHSRDTSTITVTLVTFWPVTIWVQLEAGSKWLCRSGSTFHLNVKQPRLQVGDSLLSQSQVPDHHVQGLIGEEALVHRGHAGLTTDVPHVERHGVLLQGTRPALSQLQTRAGELTRLRVKNKEWVIIRVSPWFCRAFPMYRSTKLSVHNFYCNYSELVSMKLLIKVVVDSPDKEEKQLCFWGAAVVFANMNLRLRLCWAWKGWQTAHSELCCVEGNASWF